MTDGPVPELLRRASVILAQEVGRTPGRILDGVLPELVQRLAMTGAPAPAGAAPAAQQSALMSKAMQAATGSVSPVDTVSVANPVNVISGVGMPLPNGLPPAAPGDLQKQAHELLAAVLSLFDARKGAVPALPGSGGKLPLEPSLPFNPATSGGQRCPISGAELPTFPGSRDQIRRKAHELIETLLVTFNEATGEKGLPTENQVPLVDIAGPVAPGETARVSLTVANEEASAADVSLYSTNFVADHGHELPSLRVTILPRATLIPAHGQATFEVSIAVPQQTLKGSYCGLIQAHGSRYFKAVLALDVL